VTERIELELTRIPVKGERFPTYVCLGCSPAVRRQDKINGKILETLVQLGLGTKLPYLSTFYTFGYGEFALIACVCKQEGGLPLDGTFMCDYESGWHAQTGHTDRVLLNRFSPLRSLASMAITLEHESAHGAGIAHDQEMDEVERRARDRVALAIPKLPPANVMTNTKDSYRPGCPRAGERKVRAEILITPHRFDLDPTKIRDER